MWDRFAATAALAGTVPLARNDYYVIGIWLVLVAVWIFKDHKHTGRWNEVQVSVLTDTEKTTIAERVVTQMRKDQLVVIDTAFKRPATSALPGKA